MALFCEGVEAKKAGIPFMPCPFTGPKIFLAGPNVLCHTKIYILCQTKRWFAFSKIGFCASTKAFKEALNAVKFLGWLKIF